MTGKSDPHDGSQEDKIENECLYILEKYEYE